MRPVIRSLSSSRLRRAPSTVLTSLLRCLELIDGERRFSRSAVGALGARNLPSGHKTQHWLPVLRPDEG